MHSIMNSPCDIDPIIRILEHYIASELRNLVDKFNIDPTKISIADMQDVGVAIGQRCALIEELQHHIDTLTIQKDKLVGSQDTK